ncbi:unnamed protein product [Cylicostephanus goldi]|uniref:SXP/RAL-2 family protein Ani s 5-like cation-binding domain-containing protein n=1 Tax=Cylicostephanus goldi TaxID=71465 RepID=A0A3P6RHS6_CYLGO|nr:unnamed protein product [Cylicostephanus goldi]
MQRITVLAAFAAVLCIVMGRPGDVFPQAEVWENIDLHEVLKDLSEEAKQEWSKIGSNTEGTAAQRREAENGWAKKFGVEVRGLKGSL